MRVATLAVVALVAEADKDFCCYYPKAKKLSSCDECEEKAYDTDGQDDCESSKSNTWCPSGGPSPSPSPTPSPSPSPSPSGSCPDGWHEATWTAFESWPRCCKGSPNYDKHAPTEECDDDSGCKYKGLFEYHQCDGKDGQCSLDWVQTHNIVSFFTTNGEHKQYKDSMVRLQAKGQTIEALAADTCGDGDCGGCCTKNANKHGGGLIDMEFYTVLKYFPDIKEPAVNLFEKICWQPVEAEQVV